MANRFFDTDFGVATNCMEMPVRAYLMDCAIDLRLTFDRRRKALFEAAETISRQRILVVGVDVPRRGDALKKITRELSSSRHEVVVSTVPMQAKGKFENISDAIDSVRRPLADFDWLFIVDDDVVIPQRFTDRYIAAAGMADLVISQPAHRYLSYTSFQITR